MNEINQKNATMNKLTRLFLLVAMLCALPGLTLQAQKRDDSKYLAGAVPEVDGNVVFSKSFSVPGMTKEEIYNRMLQWMEADMKDNGNPTSRVVLTDTDTGQIVAISDEWMVFTSTALALDRTRIIYQLSVVCQEEKCELEISKIRYIYRENKERYTAEEWISDKYALNKSKTKLVRGLAKWRRKTVDFVEAKVQEAVEALSTIEENKPQEKQVEEAPKAAAETPIVITQKKKIAEE